jgi:hypothetical protein
MHRWPAALPRYEVGHPRRIAAIEAIAERRPGLLLAGASYRGVGVPDCVREGERAAEAAAAAAGGSVTEAAPGVAPTRTAAAEGAPPGAAPSGAPPGAAADGAPSAAATRGPLSGAAAVEASAR